MHSSVGLEIFAALRERVLNARRLTDNGEQGRIVLLCGEGPVGPERRAPDERLMYLAACEGISVPNTLAKIVHDVLGPEFAVRYESESSSRTSNWRFVLIER